MQPNSSTTPMLLAAAIAGGLIGVCTLAGFALTRPKEAPIAQASGNTTVQDANATAPNSRPNPVTASASPSPSISSSPIPTNNLTASATPVTPRIAQPAAPAVQEPPVNKEVQTTPPTFSTGMLTSSSPNEQIPVYSEPTKQSSSPHYGVRGDVVTLLSQTTGDDHYIWYSVQFESGATGWIRADRVRDVSTIEGENEFEQPTTSVSEFPATAILSGSVPGSQVNVRSSPSLQADTPHYGLVGDAVLVVDSTQDSTGYVWYSVQFESGATGWVREDFVQF